MKKTLATVVLLIVVGCANGPRFLLTGAQSGWVNLRLAGPVATDRDGNIFVATPGNVARYHPEEHGIEELLFDPAPITALASVPGGPLLVLSGTRLEAVVAGKRVPVADLPGEGLRLVAGEHAAYLAVSAHGEYALMRFLFKERTLETCFWTAQRMDELAAAPGGCLVAVGNAIHKIFDPRDGQVDRRLVLAVSGGPITGLACDVDRQAVYFSDGDSTYGWSEGVVRHVFPVGGSLACSEGTLVIADRRHGQVVALPTPF